MTADHANELRVVVEPDPDVRITSRGFMRDADAAVYLSHHMRRSVKARTLRYWRENMQGPPFHASPGGRTVWYQRDEIDRWLAETTMVDPLAA